MIIIGYPIYDKQVDIHILFLFTRHYLSNYLEIFLEQIICFLKGLNVIENEQNSASSFGKAAICLHNLLNTVNIFGHISLKVSGVLLLDTLPKFTGFRTIKWFSELVIELFCSLFNSPCQHNAVS